MLDPFFIFIFIDTTGVCHFFAHLVLRDLAAGLIGIFFFLDVHVFMYTLFVFGPYLYYGHLIPLSPHTTPFPTSCVILFVYGKKAPSCFGILRWENWMHGFFVQQYRILEVKNKDFNDKMLNEAFFVFCFGKK